MPTLTHRLQPWNNIEHRFAGGGLLMGNGASLAIWPEFRYRSLFDMACSSSIVHPLSKTDKTIFRSFDTQHFEETLAGLNTAVSVNKALHLEVALVRARYRSVQRALVEAVAKVHIDPAWVRTDVLDIIGEELLNYEYIYSTNYDLLVYWAMARKDFHGFVDYFWNPGRRFDILNTEPSILATKVLWLHGGLHLVRHPDGSSSKRKKSMLTLLERFRFDYRDGSVPLFVSEGNHKDKLASIQRSDYLSFAYDKFTDHEGPLVVSGIAFQCKTVI